MYADDIVLVAEKDMFGIEVCVFVEICGWRKLGVNLAKIMGFERKGESGSINGFRKGRWVVPLMVFEREGESGSKTRIDGGALEVVVEFVYLDLVRDKNGKKLCVVRKKILKCFKYGLFEGMPALLDSKETLTWYEWEKSKWMDFLRHSCNKKDWSECTKFMWCGKELDWGSRGEWA